MKGYNRTNLTPISIVQCALQQFILHRGAEFSACMILRTIAVQNAGDRSAKEKHLTCGPGGYSPPLHPWHQARAIDRRFLSQHDGSLTTNAG